MSLNQLFAKCGREARAIIKTVVAIKMEARTLRIEIVYSTLIQIAVVVMTLTFSSNQTTDSENSKFLLNTDDQDLALISFMLSISFNRLDSLISLIMR